MNIEEKALSMFRAEPYRYNCAQTVCAALERMDLVEPLSACSGGRAPDGLCGALYERFNAVRRNAAQTSWRVLWTDWVIPGAGS